MRARAALRRPWLGLASCLLLGAAGCQRGVAPEPGPPNLIVVLTDDQGASDWQGADPRIHTPELSRLADEGFVLTNFHATPACSPSRVALLTGRHAIRTRAILLLPDAPARRRALRRGEVTVAELLRQAGYRTGLVGKWHLSGRVEDVPKAGFDSFYGFLDGSTSYLDPDDLYRDARPLGPVKGYASDLFAAEAVAFVRRNRDAPFFLLLALNAPHEVVEGRPDDLRHYPPESFSPRYRHTYATITSADRALGRVWAALEELGLARRSVIVFTSDNGAANGPRSKGSLYRAGAHVPFVAWGPGRVVTGTSDELTSLMDVAPTLLSWAGLAPPPGRVLDGVSLVPLLAGEPHTPPHDVLVQTWRRSYAVFDDRYRLILEHDATLGTRAQLFDSIRDPHEVDDLLRADYARARPVFERLEAALEARVRELSGEPSWTLPPFRQ